MFTIHILNIPIISMLSLFLLDGSRDDAWKPPSMVLVPGGTFLMGDVFDEGARDEKPVHKVTLNGFYLAKHEVTVGDFQVFIQATGYITSAENLADRKEQEQRISKLKKIKRFDEEAQKLYGDIIASGGCFLWDPDIRFFDFDLDCNWRNPGFAQTPRDPVMCMSWNDAASFCNWLSDKEGLPPAYDVETGELLDGEGRPTRDITKVKGYRLPTEAEWEYAARECGKKVRFGNGENVACSSRINFDASCGDFACSEKGKCRGKTVPVGSFEPNRLGLYDMSGNAWEWCSDCYGAYDEGTRVNPHGSEGPGRVIRGGRWGGDAMSARVFDRDRYEPNNRCNNAGFRVARTP